VPQDSMDVYTDHLNFELMEVVYKWALGEVNLEENALEDSNLLIIFV
jgi:hypothetical protein